MNDDLLAPLATLDKDTGKPPESRIKSIIGVRQRIDEMREAETIRSGRRAKQKGLINGNPPYPPKKLRDLGRGEDANINLRTAEGIIGAATTPYYGLVKNVPRAINVQLRYGDNPQQNYEWGETIANGYTELLADWRGYLTNIQKKQWGFVTFGVGLPMWEDSSDWRWKARTVGAVLVADDAEADVDEVDEVCIPRSFLATRLYKKIKNEATAKARGWNVEVVRQAIMDAAPTSFSKQWGRTWESYEDSLRCGDVSWNNKSSRIWVVDYLVEEYSGKWTHSIVLDDQNSGTRNSSLGVKKDDFLFKKFEEAESLSEIICPFFFDVIDEGLWHGVKGLAPKIFDYCELENRLTGKTIDQAMLGLVVVPKAADEGRKLETISRSGVTMFPPGTEFQQTKLADNLEGPLMVKEDLQRMRQDNTGQYRQPAKSDHAPTLGQEQLFVQQQSLLSEGEANRYYDSLDLLHKETLRRALKMGLKLFDARNGIMPDEINASKRMTPSEKGALKFINYCIDGGVPREALAFENFCKIESVRAMGYGSPAHRQMISDRLERLLPMMDERSKRNALRIIVAPFVGQGYVDAVFPPYDQGDVPSDHVWAATIENGELRKPDVNPISLITPKQDHATHFMIHFADATDHIQALHQGGGQVHPIDVLMHLHNAGPHLKKHLDALSGDPTRKAQLQQMGQMWLMLTKVQDQLQQQVTEAMQAEQANQQQPAPDPAMVAALLKVKGEMQIKQFKAQGDMTLKREKWDQQKRLLDAKTAHGIRTEDFKTIADATRPQPVAAAA